MANKNTTLGEVFPGIHSFMHLFLETDQRRPRNVFLDIVFGCDAWNCGSHLNNYERN